MDYENFYNQQYAQLAGLYNPQRELVGKQLAELDPYKEAQTKALEQAKINAFRDISRTAGQRGIARSGFIPSEEARYTGEKYLPALASLQQQYNSQQTALQQALNDINLRQAQEARGYVEQQRERDFKAQQLAEERAYNERMAREEFANKERLQAISNSLEREKFNYLKEQDALLKANRDAINKMFADVASKMPATWDQKFSPKKWAEIRNEYMKLGLGDKEDFFNEYYRYVNPSHKSDYM